MIWTRTFILLCLLLFACNNFAQQKAPRLFSEIIMSQQIDTLRSQFSNNKFLYEKYELQTLIALSYFPELEHTTISFKRRELRTTMAARPKGIEVFRQKGKRHYIIYINDFPSVKVSPDSVSFNAQVGIIGHELAHIVEYEKISSLKILYVGLSYFNKKFRAKFERATDLRTINHGLLWQCYDFALYVHNSKNTTTEYISYKKKFYMSPKEIKGLSD
jgi:hypothetical protein